MKILAVRIYNHHDTRWCENLSRKGPWFREAPLNCGVNSAAQRNQGDPVSRSQRATGNGILAVSKLQLPFDCAGIESEHM